MGAVVVFRDIVWYLLGSSVAMAVHTHVESATLSELYRSPLAKSGINRLLSRLALVKKFDSPPPEIRPLAISFLPLYALLLNQGEY